MVVREDTVIQVRGAIGLLDKIHDVKFVEEVVTGSPRTNRVRKQRPVQQNRICLSNVLFHSVFKGRNKKVKFLLNQGININSPNDYGYSVLIAALQINDEEHRGKMFQYLLGRDADPHARDRKYGRDVLSWASLLGRTAQVQVLLTEFAGNADLNSADLEGMTALHHATQAGHADIVRILIRELRKYALGVDVVDRLGLTPYLHAKRLGYKDIADILRLEGGASPGQADWYTFRSSTTWAKLGSKERRQAASQKLEDDFYKAAITGGARGVQLYEMALKENGDFEKIEENERAEIKHDSDSKSSTGSVPNDRSKINQSETLSPSGLDQQPEVNEIPTSGMAASLLDLAAKYKGRIPTHFRSSQTDETKVREYKKLASSMSSLMTIMSHQHSHSYRRPVAVVQHPSFAGLRDNRRKISSLAIILGKDRKKGKRSSKKRTEKTAKSQSSSKR